MASTYFELLGIVPAFNIDLSTLEKAYFAQQRLFHPDRLAGKTTPERMAALQRSADINRAYDALLDQAALTADRDARFALLRKAEALMLDDAAVAPLVFGARTYLINPAVKNWESAPLGIHRYQLVELKSP